jgi:uncharacterized membrane protein
VSDGHTHAHSHSHDDGHGLAGGWRPWLAHPALRVVLGGLAVAALATVVGLIALWPTGAGREVAVSRAAEIGLVTERHEARVESVTDAPCSYSRPDDPQDCRTITVVPDSGAAAGTPVTFDEFNLTDAGGAPAVDVGDRVVVGYDAQTDHWFFADQDRRGTLTALVLLFAVVVIALGRFRGALALLGMAATVAVLVGFVAPSVLDGNDPVLVAVVAAAAIAFVSLYLTHGFNPTTTVALAGTLGALALTLALSWVFFAASRFTGLATEEAVTLPFIAEEIDLVGLLLGGAILGALGALDDVTVTQVATVAELRRRNPMLRTADLVASGIRVGREHIASTVNTLLLAYAGASIPLLLLFAVSEQSLDMVANSEYIAIEIVRTLCGSIGLVAAVPITTLLAATLLGPAGAATAPPDLPEPTSDTDHTDTDHTAADHTAADAGRGGGGRPDGEVGGGAGGGRGAPTADADRPDGRTDDGPQRDGPARAPSWEDFAPRRDPDL